MILFYIIIGFIILDLITKDEKMKKRLSILLMIVLTGFSMFRDQSVGTDTRIFCSAFYLMNDMSIGECLETRYEILNILLFKIIGLISREPQALIVISSVIINFSIYECIIKKSKNPLTTAILYFTLNYYFSFLCLMRQALALAMVLIGFKMLEKNRYKTYCIFVILACLFHTSAIIFLLLIPFKKISKKVNPMMFVIPISIIGFLMGEKILTISTSIISDYAKYIDSEYVGSSYVTAGLYTLTSLIFLIFGLFVPARDKIDEKYENDMNYNMLKWIVAIGTIISAISIKIAVFSRVYIYFGFFSILWLSESIHLLSKKENLLIWKTIIYISTMVYVIVLSKYDWYGIFPYKFFIN